MPAVTIAPTWFDKRRGLAMGIVLAGTGIGGVIWAPILHALITKVGFRNTLRISGVICFTFMVMAGTVLEWPASRKAALLVENAALSRTQSFFSISLVDWRLVRSRKFVAHALSSILQSAAYYTPVFFFASFARTLGYDRATAANFISLSNATNAIGKILIGHAADRIGRLNALFLTTMISAMTALALWLPSCLASTQSESRNFFIAFAVLYGTFASAYVALFPTSLVEVFGVQNFASVNGVLYMARGMATLVGTPVAGILIHHDSYAARGGHDLSAHGYKNASILVGALLFSATLAVLWVRIEAATPIKEGPPKWRL
jgi:MFS family permease